jgi:competence protein ComEA
VETEGCHAGWRILKGGDRRRDVADPPIRPAQPTEIPSRRAGIAHATAMGAAPVQPLDKEDSMNRNLSRQPLRTLLAPALALGLGLLATAPAAAQSAAGEKNSPPVAAAPADAEAPGVVNINTASELELMRLPGVGPSKARAIVQLRERLQRFKRVEGIMRVRGIGRKTFRKLRSMLTIEGETTLQQAPRTRR